MSFYPAAGREFSPKGALPSLLSSGKKSLFFFTEADQFDLMLAEKRLYFFLASSSFFFYSTFVMALHLPLFPSSMLKQVNGF